MMLTLFALCLFHCRHVEKFTVTTSAANGIAVVKFKKPFAGRPSCTFTKPHWLHIRKLDGTQVEIWTPLGDTVSGVCR
jgi:hypothetical protein